MGSWTDPATTPASDMPFRMWSVCLASLLSQVFGDVLVPEGETFWREPVVVHGVHCDVGVCFAQPGLQRGEGCRPVVEDTVRSGDAGFGVDDQVVLDGYLYAVDAGITASGLVDRGLDEDFAEDDGGFAVGFDHIAVLWFGGEPKHVFPCHSSLERFVGSAWPHVENHVSRQVGKRGVDVPLVAGGQEAFCDGDGFSGVHG